MNTLKIEAVRINRLTRLLFQHLARQPRLTRLTKLRPIFFQAVARWSRLCAQGTGLGLHSFRWTSDRRGCVLAAHPPGSIAVLEGSSPTHSLSRRLLARKLRASRAPIRGSTETATEPFQPSDHS